MTTPDEQKDYDESAKLLKQVMPGVALFLNSFCGKGWKLNGPSELRGPDNAHLRVLPIKPHKLMQVSIESAYDAPIDQDFQRPGDFENWKVVVDLHDGQHAIASKIAQGLIDYFDWLAAQREFLFYKKIEQKRKTADKVLSAIGGNLVVDGDHVFVETEIKNRGYAGGGLGLQVFIECFENGNVNYKFTCGSQFATCVFQEMQEILQPKA